jgi:hypothetical protein
LTILTFSILNAFDIKKFYGSLKYCPSEYLNGGGGNFAHIEKANKYSSEHACILTPKKYVHEDRWMVAPQCDE